MTKSDLQQMREMLREEIPTLVRIEMQKLGGQLQKEFEDFRQEIRAQVDAVAKQAIINNQERLANNNTHEEHYKRIEKLEKIHPDYMHVPTVA